MNCVLKIDRMPMEAIDGRIIITVYKRHNDEIVATTYRTLSAYKEGVIITDWSNAPIQEALYSAGLVANETYTLKSEAKVITAAQLQPGTTQTTSIFYVQRTNIKSFDEFQYFTGVTKVLQRTFQGCNDMTSITLPNGVTELEDYVFQGCSALTNITLSTSLLKLGSSTFAACSSLVSMTLPTGFTTIGSNTFIDCPNLETLYIPASTNTIGGNVFMNCGKLNIVVDANNQTFKSVDGVLFNKSGVKLIEYAKDAIQPEYVVPDGVTYVGNYAFYNRKNMTYIKFPSTLARFGNDVLSMCNNLKTLRFDGMTAPSLDNANVFGAADTAYTGRNTYNTGANKLYLSQLNATGFEEGLWLDPLQNASKCGFTIHGKLVINSNRSNATFGVAYTAEDNSSKNITLPVGIAYLSDIKYGTTVTITPRPLTGYTWDSNSVSFTYSATTNSATLNAYVYPANATISGETNPVDNPTYTWTTSTANVDGEYTATWSLSGDVTSYMSIASQNNESCTLSIIEAPTEEITGTLTLSIKPKVGNTVTATKTLKALLPGVVITSKSNAPVQVALYAAGAVANETYSLKSELERISDCSTMFNSKGILTFDEFQYFTAVRTLPADTFSGNTNLSRITIPKNVSTIATLFLGRTSSSDKAYISVDSANASFASVDGALFNKSKTTLIKFALGKTISNYTIPSSVTTITEHAFYRCDVQTISCVNALHIGEIWGCSKLTKLNFDIASITGINGIISCSSLQEISFADGFTTSATNMINLCKAISKITSKSVIAPTLPSGTFGDAGKNNTSGTNRLILPINATGYESGTWAQLVVSNGFYIHGKLVITSNKSNAQFNVTYTTESGTLKTVTVGVGTWYLNDIKYSTSITIAAVALSGYTWQEQTKTFTYSKTTNTANFNAYIYPTSVTISGDSAIKGGNNATYTASVSPSNVDIGVTYTWSISGSSNASISSTDGNTCVIETLEVSSNETSVLKCVIESSDKKVNISKEIQLSIEAYVNLITVTYDVTSTSSNTKLVNNSYYVSYMDIDGVVQTYPQSEYKFSSKGLHTVTISCSLLNNMFKDCIKITSVDLSRCDGSLYKSLEGCFSGCTNLKNITWGAVDMSGITSLRSTFYNCGNLETINLSALKGASNVVMLSAFEGCNMLKVIDLSPLNSITTLYALARYCSNLTEVVWGNVKTGSSETIADIFYNCTALKSIDLSVFNGVTLSSTNSAFRSCSSLEIIDMSPLASTGLGDYCFHGCTSLKTIIVPWSTAPTATNTTFGSSNNYFTGRNTYSTGQNILYVPAGATGYDSSYWLNPLQNASKCGFTLSATL